MHRSLCRIHSGVTVLTLVQLAADREPVVVRFSPESLPSIWHSLNRYVPFACASVTTKSDTPLCTFVGGRLRIWQTMCPLSNTMYYTWISLLKQPPAQFRWLPKNSSQFFLQVERCCFPSWIFR